MYLWKNFSGEAFPTHGVILNIKLHKIWDIFGKKIFGYLLPMWIYGQNKEKTLWPKGEKTPKGAARNDISLLKIMCYDLLNNPLY